jgi:thiol:disulfide interchange protein DsbD
MRFPVTFRILLALLWLIVPAAAQFGALGGAPVRVKTTLVAEHGVIAPGQPFTVWLRMDHEPEWHTFYRNPGLVGNPLTIKWELPAGFTAGPVQWPVPKLASQVGEAIFAYEGVAYFPVVISPPADLRPGTSVSLVANAKWQVCQDLCLNEAASLRLDLPVAAEPVANAGAAEELATARAAMPITTDAWAVSATSNGGEIVINLTMKDGAIADPGEIFFFSADQQTYTDQKVERTVEGLRIIAKRAVKDYMDEPIPVRDNLSGIFKASTGWVPGNPSHGLAISELPFTTAAPSEVGESPKAPTLFAVMGGMFLGGLILNLMPCVFPVIGIKIMGFVHQAGHDRRKVVVHGMVFAAGVLISFWVLAGLLFAGGIANWGNQMQDPRVILATLVIMLLFGMNLFGVFELGTSATGIGGNLTHQQGMAGTFFSGVLATVIATPCSGPFLGVAIGAAAATKSGPLFFLAFTLMGIGLALPYLVLSMFPKLVDKLPRPGAWMESFKQGMSFLLFAAVGVFLWVYSNQVFERSDGQKGLWVMLGLAAVAAAAWIYGRWTQPVRATRTRMLARLSALVMLAAGIALAWPWPETKTSIWEEWSQEKVDKALAEGRPVYIDFTAKWCLTCQVNKRRAYSDEVLTLIKDRNILMLRADKTKDNAEIDAALAALGRSAIPVNVFYEPGKDRVITPEILAPGILLDLFSASGGSPAPDSAP